MAHIGMDFSNVPQYAGNEPLPTGWYIAAMTASELKPTKDAAQTQHFMLSAEYTIMDGQYKGRKVFQQYNIGHSNPATKEIAFKQLSSIAHAVGVIQVQDSQQFHGLPLKIRVKLKEGGEKKDAMGTVVGKYDPQNEVVGYKNVNEVTPVEGPVTVGVPAGFGQGAPAFNTGAAPAFQPAAAPQFQPAPAAAAPAFAPAQAQFAQPASAAFQPQQAPVQQFQQAAPAQFQQAAPVMQQPQFQQPMQQPTHQFTAQPAATSAAPAAPVQTAQVAEQPAWAGGNPQQAPMQQQQQVAQAAPTQPVPTGAPIPPWLQQQAQ